jgi:Zn-dependent protease with chaperone function/uncharacterized tellurite resistance protein B-like protein
MAEAGESLLLRLICLDLATLPLLHKTSAAAAVFGGGFLGLLLLSSLIIGKNRKLLATIFPVVVQASLYFVILSILLQGTVLTLGSYIGQGYFMEKTRLYLVIGVGIGALAAAYKLFDGIFDYGGKLRTNVAGIPVSESKAPGLHDFVKAIAAKLGAKAPDNIVIGLEPNFFVTSAEVVTPASGKPLAGETLYVSVPLARLMTVPEFAAVIGHELGHFRGEDTVFSLKFAPVYAGLAEALADTKFDKGEKIHHGIAKVPARAILHFVMDVFAMNERAISRQRELVADQAGAEASSPQALVTALTKTSLYAGLWDVLQNENIDRLNRGKATRNLSSVLEGMARYDVDRNELAKVIAEVAKKSIPHPTDRHPPIGARMKSLDIDAASITDADMEIPENSAILLFRNAGTFEENLSVMEHKRMADLGFAPPLGRGTGGVGQHFSAIYRIAAAMIAVDRKVGAEEVHVAEAAGAELFPGFEQTDFRQACNYAGEIPDMEFLTGELNEFLDETQKNSIITYLRKIAEADGDLSLGEQVYIEAVAEELGISPA